MRNRIFGAIGVLWGGGTLLSRLLSGHWVNGSGAYRSGQMTAVVLAILLFVVGLYYLITGGAKSKKSSSAPPAA